MKFALIAAALGAAAAAAPRGAAAAAPPAVLLRNAAAPGTAMPWSGAGSGGYTGNSSQPYGAYVRLTRTTLRPPLRPQLRP
jgi:hypothetical protein